MMAKEDQEVRPVYRHLVVNRKGYMSLAASPKELQRAKAQLREVDEGTREAVDPDLAYLVKKNHLRQTMRKVYGAGYEEPDDGPASRQGGAIVVGRLTKVKIPGGDEPLPHSATFWRQAAAWDEMDPQEAFMQAAQVLQKRFQKESDLKVKLLPKTTIAGLTLVTVVYAPMAAYALQRQGFEVGMEFIQKTRFGPVDAGGFEVHSEEGIYPITPPSDHTVSMYVKTMAEIGPMKGFLSDEERAAVKRGEPVIRK